MSDKAKLREAMRYRCETRMPAFNAMQANSLAARVMQIIPTLAPQARIIATYYPLVDEIDSRPLTPLLREAGYELALPLMIAKDRPLSFRAWRAGDRLEKTSYGLAQPQWSAPEVAPDLIIVPILGFNAEGYRLGRGGGSYDRTLANGDLLTVGLAASFQQIDFTPDSHDCALTAIVTEQGMLQK